MKSKEAVTTPTSALEPRFGSGWPFTFLRRFSEDMERVFGDFGTRDFFGAPLFADLERMTWMPELEVMQKGDQLIVHADLPGLTKEDVKLEITEEMLTISGERKREQEEKGEGFYRAERRYGNFCRTLPLPDGVKPDTAKATFKNGVLEIVMTVPARRELRPRRVEIEAPGEKMKSKSAA